MKPLSEIEAALDRQGEELAWNHAMDVCKKLRDSPKSLAYDISKASFKTGHDSLKGPLLEAIKVIERLSKVGPPSKPTTGAEWPNQALADNCEIARVFLDKTEKELGLK